MLTRIALQYRRFVLCSILLTVFFLLAIWLGYGQMPPEFEASSWPMILTVWTVLLIICIGTPVILFSIVANFMLPLLEIWLTALILLMLTRSGIQALLPKLDIPGWIDCIALGALSITMYVSFYGSWFNGLLKKDTKKKTIKFRVTGTPETVWNALVPSPETPKNYYWPRAEFLPARRGSDASFVMTLPRRGSIENVTQEVFIEHKDLFREVRYRARSLPGCSDPDQNIEIRLTAMGDKCEVEFTRQLKNVPIGSRIFHYLSSEFQDTVFSMKRRLAGRRDGSLQGRQMLRN